MKIEFIAKCCHEINKTYCESIGDYSQVPWEEAPLWQRESAIAGVEFSIANPKSTPADSHESWYKHKKADGWVYGPVKDVVKKEHPCMVPYDDLPEQQKAKDKLFKTVVNLLK